MSAAETPWVRSPVREVLSVRVKPEIKASLESFVAGAQAQGWTGLRTNHVIEHLLRDLLTEEGRARVMAELAEAKRG